MDSAERQDVVPAIVPTRKLSGRIAGLFRTISVAKSGSEDKGFETTPVPHLDLGFDGIDGDRHGGTTRRSGGREPWYTRGTKIRNERQLSLLSPDELAAVARDLAIPELKPEWIGGNLLVKGIDRLTLLPPRTLMMFEGGVTLKIDGDNAPCRLSGRSVARRFVGRGDLEFGFVQTARRSRGLVAWVEKPGRIEVGEAFEARLPEQWIYF